MSLLLPEKFPVKFYSWQDQDAPRLENIVGCIKTILKACLVTGYGDKQGAGWTALFEDDYRIVLRRPLRTGNPPDIKIENGVINGTASHRIVSQDNPQSLDDTTALATSFFINKGFSAHAKWYMVVSDFGFWFGLEDNASTYGILRTYRTEIYIGSTQKINAYDDDIFIYSTATINNSSSLSNTYDMFHSSHLTLNMRTNTKYTLKSAQQYINEKGFPIAQPIWVGDKAILPFYCDVFSLSNNSEVKQIQIQNRPMLRFHSQISTNSNNGWAMCYIPLDYWEL